MVSFSQAKDMFRLQREAKKVKKELRNIHVEAEGPGVKVVVNGEQEVISIEIAPDINVQSLPGILKDAMNRAMKKAQLVSAERMRGIMGDMGMPMAGGQEGM